jgi:hypothetical protein
MSIEELAKITPVTPPKVNKKTKPKDQRRGASEDIQDPCMVASQEKILIPVGIAIIIVAAVK